MNNATLNNTQSSTTASVFSTQSSTTTVLLCGVGGQGTVLAADVLARVALSENKIVKVSEIHGMAQRGGSVSTVVRFENQAGSGVFSMVCDLGCADVVVSFETTEALRNISYLKPGGHLIVATDTIIPLPVAIGAASMPENAQERLSALGACLVPATKLARAAGTEKASNMVLLGALSNKLPFAKNSWEEVIKMRVPPKTIDANLAAFAAGKAQQ